jgi:hypothetical protein
MGGILWMIVIVTIFFVIVNEYQTKKEIKKGKKR